MNKQVSSEGSIVFWSSRRTQRSIVCDAFAKVGAENLVPKIDYFAALKSAARQVAEACGLRSNGRLTYSGLAHDRNAVGVEVRRLVKGKEMNDLPFLFSLGVGTDGQSVIVLRADPNESPEVAAHKAAVEDAATRVWNDCCGYITANDLTNAIVALLRRQHAVLLRDGGVVWHVSSDKLPPYQSIASDLAPHGPKLVACVFDPVVNATLVEHVADELNRRAMEVFERQINHASEMKQRGAKPRRNGQKSRLEEWIETESTVQHMKQVLGKSFTNLCKAAAAAREAIGAEGRQMMRESA
jgi:hypothetical protein